MTKPVLLAVSLAAPHPAVAPAKLATLAAPALSAAPALRAPLAPAASQDGETPSAVPTPSERVTDALAAAPMAEGDELDLSKLSREDGIAALAKRFPRVDFAGMLSDAHDQIPNDGRPIGGGMRYHSLLRTEKGWMLEAGCDFRQDDGAEGTMGVTYEARPDGEKFRITDTNVTY